MSDKPIAPCCGCNPEYAGLAPRPNTANGVQHWVFCPECGMHGPYGFGEDEAISRWNAICSAIPHAQIEALKENEQRLANAMTAPLERLARQHILAYIGRLSSLLHPELKGEDKQ